MTNSCYLGGEINYSFINNDYLVVMTTNNPWTNWLANGKTWNKFILFNWYIFHDAFLQGETYKIFKFSFFINLLLPLLTFASASFVVISLCTYATVCLLLSFYYYRSFISTAFIPLIRYQMNFILSDRIFLLSLQKYFLLWDSACFLL